MPEIVGRLRTPRLSGPPASPVVGEMYFDTGTNTLYWWNGTSWISASGGGGGSINWSDVGTSQMGPLAYGVAANVLDGSEGNGTIGFGNFVSQVIPAGAFGTSRLLRCILLGSYKNATGASTAIQFRARYGGVVLWDTSASTTILPQSATRRSFHMQAFLQAVGVGAVELGGFLTIGGISAAVAGLFAWTANAFGPLPMSSNGPLAVDTTIAQAFDLGVLHGSNSTNIDLTIESGLIEVVG